MQEPNEPVFHSDRIPEELMQRLHEANTRFHEVRERLEATTAGTEYRHEERVDAARAELRQVEREIEEVEERIRKLMNGETH